MKRAVRWLWRLLCYAIVAFLGGGGVWLYDRVPSDAGGCAADTRTVITNSVGDAVEAQEEYCWGSANSATVILSLVMKSGVPPYRFLSYPVERSEPILHWEGDDTLVVSLHGAKDAFTKGYYYRGITIRYE